MKRNGDNMEIKAYDFLHNDVYKIRDEVFVIEQEFKEEFDEIDNNCIHLAMYDNERAIAICRFYPVSENIYAIGRIAVVKDYRQKGIGSKIVLEAENCIKNLGAEYATLSAQVRAKEFYKKLGYTPEGEEYFEEYCPHIKMKKKLN